MITINLLPEAMRKKESAFKKIDLSGLNMNLENIPVVKIAAGVFAALIIIQVALFFIGIYSRSCLVSISKKYNEILPEKKEADALATQVATINRKLKAIDELMVKRFEWAKKLNDLSDSVTAGIWLTGLSYEESVVDRLVQQGAKTPGDKGRDRPGKPIIEKTLSRYLIISGYASSMGDEGTALIGKFIKSLKDNPEFYADFSDIELGAIKRDKVEDQEVMSFTITCLFGEER